MHDITLFNLIAVGLRIIGSLFFISVLYYQVLVLNRCRNRDNLSYLRVLMIGLTLAPFMFNFMAIYNSVLIICNGYQNETINNIYFVLGAISSVATAIILWLIYRRR